MERKFTTAREVSEHLLEATGTALMCGDFDSFQQHFLLPQELQTFEGMRVLKHVDDLKSAFEAVRSFYHRTGVTDIARHCIEAAFKDEQTIEAVHETRLLSGHVLCKMPFATLSTLRLVDGHWMVNGTSYAIAEPPGLNSALLGTGT